MGRVVVRVACILFEKIEFENFQIGCSDLSIGCSGQYRFFKPKKHLEECIEPDHYRHGSIEKKSTDFWVRVMVGVACVNIEKVGFENFSDRVF